MADIDALPLDFCLTFVRGRGPDEVISLLGGADPVSIGSGQVAFEAADAVAEWVDDDGVTHPTELAYIVATRIDDWTMIIEPNGFLCTDTAVRETLSAGGEMVSFYYNEHTTPRFSWSVDGQEVVGFDPAYPADRSGADPGRLTALGFEPQPDDSGFVPGFKERTAALMARLTGVDWDSAFLEQATFRCAGVGPGASGQPWYGEVQEELTAFAEDPRDWTDEIEREQWLEAGVTDRRIRALGPVGIRVYEEDADLAARIAHAPAKLIRRMTEWAWERPFRLAGIADEPWFAPIRNLVLRGRRPAPAAVRLVEERMDPFLRTALPVWMRDDEDRRRNAVAVLLAQWDTDGPLSDLCWTFARVEGAGAGEFPDLLADLKRGFPELGDVVVPQPSPAPPERAAVRRKREAREREEAEWKRENLELRWGGRVPIDERLLDPEVEMHATGLVPYDRDLIDQITASPAEAQRRMAVWAARYCCTRSDMIENDWVEAGVLALERGEPPPDWFTDFDAAFARWQNVPGESITHTATVTWGPGEPVRIDPAIIAMHTIVTARHDDPLIAVMDTLHNTVVNYEPETVITAFRAAFDLPTSSAKGGHYLR
ncbi:hypothetical protein Q0Z83_027630 [Actinoplanes sichuanensis]|uniref:DUF6461 domain-containing protein n=1 Tax=Actinoplanes sichuanensis TaxID=512349 RepID=A0ABW4AVA7_9ACTN|nr:DUF6461 domain-containing protein [Actinoplanes sichuanensis]BEL04572.1 hypothetical protein Q0Z83_027630 [Actinoplanes sichuanensis]